jgi:methionyl-tRNA formyltransferase
MAAELDAGAVLATEDCPIREHDSLDRVIIETKREAARLLIRTLRELATGTTTAQPLDMTNARTTVSDASDAASFRKRGHRML